MERIEITRLLAGIANEYPMEMVPGQIRDVPRISFNISLAIGDADTGHLGNLAICDIGGGLGMFSVGCAAAGFGRSVLVDDFNDSFNHRSGNAALSLHRKYNVEVFSRDVVRDGIRDIEGSFDIITTFDSMEHWHNSPKRLLQDVVGKLKPSGSFVLGVPNCVSLRKRITVPFGHGKWTLMQDWYEEEVFRGHVREPDVGDLKYIAHDMHLDEVTVLGRNWLGYGSSRSWIRTATRLVDYPLRMIPSLCSDLYLIGKKSA
jgi:2-polyprenyl-3-methyl-5-hydroxy-6-metoxy-1,4-benzoquinol methylase